MRNYTRLLLTLFAVAAIAFVACHTAKKNNAQRVSGQSAMHNGYDDSTLNNRILPVMMPYNRIIDPAGSVISFGSADDENHSMDVQLIPGTTKIAVEDRFGIAVIDTASKKITARWTYSEHAQYKGMMSTYSGLKVYCVGDKTFIFWSAAVAKGKQSKSAVFQAALHSSTIEIEHTFDFTALAPAPLALPNELAIHKENGIGYLYVVLNGNDQLVKISLNDNSTIWTKPTGVAPYGIAIVNETVFVSNWAGPRATDSVTRETAGVPYGSTYTDPKTGATAAGTVSVFGTDGIAIKELEVGLHPNAVIGSPDGKFVYVANGNSDKVSVISVGSLQTVEEIDVKLMPGEKSYLGDTPNALALDKTGSTLYVANGLDNAVAVVRLGSKAAGNGTGDSQVKGFIPTEAYPGGLAIDDNKLFVTNLEGEGARSSIGETTQKNLKGEVGDGFKGDAFNAHHQKATVSIISIPDSDVLQQWTERVKRLNLTFREEIAQLLPRRNISPKPMPERIGEPSVFNHVLYIIKENRTYDQVLGDMPEGNGSKSLCIYGDSITPNQHSMARSFLLLDNYYASGKCSAEGHQWTDAGMVTDYVEKSVRAWFRSYPHVQTDALVYDQNGFIWNNAADHGKTVRIYGEACTPHFDEQLTWSDIYNDYKAGKPFPFTNTSTIARVRPMLSQNYPASDELKISEQLRADAFINELKDYERQPGDALPQLMVMALSSDHTVGTRPGYPTPNAMVADNDLALGRIVEALSKSRFWKNTVVFVTEDDSQSGWDHVSAYRTTGFVISGYSLLKRRVSTNYNQTSFVRSIEQILGIPPMNIMDATALPMFHCFDSRFNPQPYTAINNRIPLNALNPELGDLKGPALHFARQSLKPEYDHPDGGNDDEMNRILWSAAKGNQKYPAKLAGKDDED